MAIGIKKFGDPHIYTVLSYDDDPNDLHYCCVKYEPEFEDFTHPHNVNLADHDWERIDRHEVELFATSWVDILYGHPEVAEHYNRDFDASDIMINEDLASAVTWLKFGSNVNLDTLRLIVSSLSDAYHYQVNLCQRSPDIEVHCAETYTEDDLNEIQKFWGVTTLVQPHLIEKHMAIINKLIKESELEASNV